MSIKEYHTKRQPLLGQSNNALVYLFAINALIFVLLNFLKIVYFLSYTDNITAEVFFINRYSVGLPYQLQLIT